MRDPLSQGIPNMDSPSSAFPYGRAKDSNPPSARNGTPIREANLLTDIPYACYAIIKAAGLTPNNVPENIDDSQVLEALNILYAPFDTHAPHNGFFTKTDSEISFDDPTRTLTIDTAFGSSEYQFRSNDIVYTKDTPLSIQVDAITDGQYIYFDDDGILRNRTTFSLDLIYRWAYVAYVKMEDGFIKRLVCANERHTEAYPPAVHEWAHNVIRTGYDSGFEPNNLDVDGSGNDDSSSQIGMTNGICRDEDLDYHVSNGDPQTISPIAMLPKLHYTGVTDWKSEIATSSPILTTGSGRAAYNDAALGTLVEVTNNKFVLMHVVFCDDLDEPITALVGQNEYNTISAARAGAKNELANVFLAGLPVQEFKPLFTFIVQTADSYLNAVKSRFRLTDDGDDFIDWRFTNFFVSSGGGGGGTTQWTRDDINGYLYNNFLTDKIGFGTLTPEEKGEFREDQAADTALQVTNSLTTGSASLKLKSDGETTQLINSYVDDKTELIYSESALYIRKNGIIYGIKVENNGTGYLVAIDDASKILKFGVDDRIAVSLGYGEIVINEARQIINLKMHSVAELNTMFVNGDSGKTGFGTDDPGRIGGAGGPTPSTVGKWVHIKDVETDGSGNLIIEGYGSPIANGVAKGYGAVCFYMSAINTLGDNKNLRWMWGGGALVLQLLNDDLTVKIDNVMVVSSSNGNVSFSKALVVGETINATSLTVTGGVNSNTVSATGLVQGGNYGKNILTLASPANGSYDSSVFSSGHYIVSIKCRGGGNTQYDDRIFNVSASATMATQDEMSRNGSATYVSSLTATYVSSNVFKIVVVTTGSPFSVSVNIIGLNV